MAETNFIELLKLLEMNSDAESEFCINRCQVCGLTVRDTKLKRCAGCFSISYCSKEHQIMHWKKHKDICKVLKKVQTMVPVSSDLGNISNWNEHRDKFHSLCRLEMKNMQNKFLLSGNERCMSFLPGRCEICRTVNAGIACHACLNVNYCSEEHRILDSKHHAKLCSNLKLIMDIESYLNKGFKNLSFHLR